MKLVISGSRRLTDKNTLLAALAECPFASEITEIISGGAKGIDTLAKEYAILNKIPFTEVKADWNRYGFPAGPIRNQQMIDIGEALLAIRTIRSPGTLDCIKKAKIKGIPIHVYKVNTF